MPRQVWRMRRMVIKLTSGLVCLAFAGCTSTLVVTSDTLSDASGLPFYLMEHYFVVTELGLAADGTRTSNAALKVDLATRPNKMRGFRVRNAPAGFADSEFKITRDVQGGLVSLSGKTDDRTLEAIQALATTVRTAAMFASAETAKEEEENLARVEQELLKDLKKLTEELQASSNAATRAEKVERIEKVEKALGVVRARIQEIRVARAPKPGVAKSDTKTPFVEVVEDHCERIRLQRVQQVNAVKKGDVVVVLVPANAGRTCP
jgi:hypothetical protein